MKKKAEAPISKQIYGLTKQIYELSDRFMMSQENDIWI